MIKEKELISILGGTFSIYNIADNIIRIIKPLGNIIGFNDIVIRKNKGKSGRKLLY